MRAELLDNAALAEAYPRAVGRGPVWRTSVLKLPNGAVVDGFCGSTPPFTLRVGDKFGLINADGSAVTALHFDAIVGAGPGIWNAKIDGKWGRIGLDGRWLFVHRAILSARALSGSRLTAPPGR